MRDRIAEAALWARRHRAEIGETLGDAVGAASLMGLLFVLSFLGEMFR